MADPNVPQGTLNRLRGSIAFDNNAILNVIASNLGAEGINLTFAREATTRIDAMTGQVTSPEPYIPVRITINLLRTQALASLWELQRLSNTLLGDGTFFTDAAPPGVALYRFLNISIGRVGDMRINGKDALYGVEIDATYPINSTLWN